MLEHNLNKALFSWYCLLVSDFYFKLSKRAKGDWQHSLQIFDKEVKSMKWSKDCLFNFSTNCIGKISHSHVEKVTLDTDLYLSQKYLKMDNKGKVKIKNNYKSSRRYKGEKYI